MVMLLPVKQYYVRSTRTPSANFICGGVEGHAGYGRVAKTGDTALSKAGFESSPQTFLKGRCI